MKSLYVNSCNRSFFGKECFKEHNRNRSTGDRYQILYVREWKNVSNVSVLSLFVLMNTNADIVNVVIVKKYCDMHEHRCFMMRKECKGGNCTGCEEKKRCVILVRTRTDKYMFYDFETNQETGVHMW